MGYASAMARRLFLTIIAVTAVQLVVAKRLVHYQGER